MTLKTPQDRRIRRKGAIPHPVLGRMTRSQRQAVDLAIPGQPMLQIGVLIRLRHVRHRLSPRPERPSPVRCLAQSARMMRLRLRRRHPGMTNGAGLRSREVLRRRKPCPKQQKRPGCYQVNRPLYWNCRPRYPGIWSVIAPNAEFPNVVFGRFPLKLLKAL